MPWMLAAAAVSVGGSLLASSNAADAAQQAGQLQYQASQAATAEQQHEFDTIQQETAPGRNLGNAAGAALGSYFGLPGYSNGQATGAGGSASGSGGPAGYYGYPVTLPGSSPMTANSTSTAFAAPPSAAAASPAPMTRGEPSFAPSIGTRVSAAPAANPQMGVVTSGTDGIAPPTAAATPAPAAGAPDWNAFLQDPANADVLAWAQSGHGDPNTPIDQQSLQQRAAYWYYNAQRTGDPRGQQALPTVQAPQSSGTGPATTPAPGFSDPTSPSGYTVGPRPMTGPQPQQYQAPARTDYGAAPTRQTMGPLDVSAAAYQESPGFQFQMQQAQRALDANSSATGGIQSGSRLKAAADYATGLANQDYTDWRNYTTGQYNINHSFADQEFGQNLSQYDTQQARADNIYNYDRAFNYGAGQDALAQWNLNRANANTVYESDRSYAANRQDTRAGQLMQLAGLGSGATNTSANAAQNYANAYGNLAMAGANAKGSAAINSANAWTSGFNNLLTTGAYLGGQYLGANGGFGGSGAMTGGGPLSTVGGGGFI